MKANRLFALLLCLVLAVSLLPAGALAAHDPSLEAVFAPAVTVDAGYNVGTTAITAGAPASGPGWTWNGANTLTLNNAAIRSADNASGSSYGVRLPAGSTVILSGDSTVMAGSASVNSFAVCGAGALTLTGSGRLTAVGGDAAEMSVGIASNGDLSLAGGFTGSLTAVGGAAVNVSSGIMADDNGVAGSGVVTVDGACSVTAVGGLVTGSDNDYYSSGVKAAGFDLNGAAKITAVGGEASGSKSVSFGVYCESAAININNSAAELTAVGGKVVNTFGRSNGIRALYFTLDAGSVTAVGGEAGTISSGIYCYSCVANEGTLTAIAGKVTDNGSLDSYSYGLYSAGTSGYDSVKVAGGAVIARGGDGADYSYGVLASTGEITFEPAATAGNTLLVSYAGQTSGGVGQAFFSDITSTYSCLIGSDTTRYAVYGTGVYAQRDAVGGNLTHVFDAAQSAAPAAPFVIIDSGNTGSALSVDNTTASLNTVGVSVLIAGDTTGSNSSNGLVTGGDLAITGSGTLVALGGTVSGSGVVSAGVGTAANKSLTVSSGVNLVAGGGVSDANSSGIYADALSTAGACSVTAVGGSGTSYSFGACAASNPSGPYRLDGGCVAAVGGSANRSYGLRAEEGAIFVAGASVSAVGGSAGSFSSYGVETDTLSVSGGVLRAVGGGGTSSFGVETDTFVLNSGAVCAVGGHSQTYYSCGLKSGRYDGFSMTGGALCVAGGSADAASFGYSAFSAGLVLQNGGLFDISGGLLAAFGGRMTGGSCGILSRCGSASTPVYVELISPRITAAGNNQAIGCIIDSSTQSASYTLTLSGVNARAGADATGAEPLTTIAAGSYTNTQLSTYKFLRTEALPAPPVPIIDPVTPSPSPSPKPTPKPWTNPYSDVSASDWFYDAVKYVSENGLMRGVGEGQFLPSGAVTRATVWQTLYNMNGGVSAAIEPWYADAQSWAVANGISDGTDPEGLISREMLVTMLYRYAIMKGMDAVNLAEYLTGYPDGGEVSGWAIQAMNWALGAAMLEGSEGHLLPTAGADRASLAALLMRFCEKAK